jgi:hypothetical protein
MPADNDRERDLHTLLNLIDEAQALVDSSGLPDDRSKRLREVLSSAVSLANDLIETSPAAELGKKGGTKTAERGPEYFRKIASMRKTKAGGRPRKKT